MEPTLHIKRNVFHKLLYRHEFKVIFFDNNHAISDINRAMEIYIGKSLQHIEGKTIYEVLLRDSDCDLKNNIHRAITGDDTRFEFSAYNLIILDDGEGKVVLIDNSPSLYQQLSALEDKNAQLTKRLRLDPLTGLANQVCIDELRENIFATKETAGIIVYDVDNFKEINADHGYIGANTYLKSIAECLQETVRSSDIIAANNKLISRYGGDELISRYGGDEFVVLLPKMDASEVDNIARRSQQAVKEAMQKKHGLLLSISAGTAISSDHSNAKQWFEKANKNLKKHKEVRKALQHSRNNTIH